MNEYSAVAPSPSSEAAKARVLNDEPASRDRLERRKLARALAATTERCETPLVLGLYGTWGTGKTSLMRIMQEELMTTGGAIPVWFDAWQHQFDENPVVALLHKMVDELNLGEEGRRLLHVIAGAFGSLLLKSVTSLNTTELHELSNRYDEERFLIREKQIRLRTHFSELLNRATDNGAVRIVFFIDDLDRCVPEQVLRVLEALKLFLNMDGCVYVLGVDRVALENSIRHRYENKDVNEAEYLDKIVQLPFSIPPITSTAMKQFINDMLPTALQEVTPDLVACLDENPRQVKRFVNSFLLNHELALQTLTERYNPSHLASVLLLQYRRPDLFKQALSDSTVFAKLSEEGADQRDDWEPWMEHIGKRLGDIPSDQLGPYMYLSEAATVRTLQFDVVLTDVGTRKVPLIKAIRQITGSGLREAKDLAEAEPPTVIHSASSREEAERMVVLLKEGGGLAEIQ